MDHKSNMMTGVVKNLRRGEEVSSAGDRNQLLAFRLELRDAAGDISRYLQVEMRGDRIAGDVAEGDTVEITARGSREGIVATKSLRNLTTTSRVYVRGDSTKTIKIVIQVVIVLIIIASAIAAWRFFHKAQSFEPATASPITIPAP